MCQGKAMVLVLLTGSLVGCVSSDAQRTTARFSAQPFNGPTGDDVVQLLVALIEKPVGDRALNQEIWTLADEQGVDLENKGILKKNGLRMGQFGSAPPASLQELIRSERSCINPRWISMHAGKPTTVALGPAWGRCAFELYVDNQGKVVELDEALCQLEVVPTLTADSKTKLQFTPCIKHGRASLTPRPVHDPSGTLRWELQVQQPLESFPRLSWSQVVGENEYLVIGTWLDRYDTLGQRCFIQSESQQPVQRLLVLRAVRTSNDTLPPDRLLGRSPLALQASLSAARASAR